MPELPPLPPVAPSPIPIPADTTASDRNFVSAPPISRLTKAWRLFYRLVIIIGILSLIYYFFLQPMQVSGRDPVDPFVVGQQIFSERASYLFREPQVGDAVVFNAQTETTNYNYPYFGIIAKIINQNNVKTYQIISTKTQQNPWVVSRDKILAHIYYPVFQSTNLPVPTPSYTCPPTGYIDCMPVLDATKQKACSSDAINWYKANCPNFQGGAL